MSRTSLVLVAFAAVTQAACRENPVQPDLGPLRPSLSVDQSKSSVVVNSTADDGDGTCTDTKCTLRDAIAWADPGATITFAASLTEGGRADVGLTAGQLTIAKNLTIAGPGADQLAVSRTSESKFRIFRVISGTTASISGLAIWNGAANGDPSNDGSGVHNAGTLHLSGCDVSGNRSFDTSVGGGIYNSGTLTIDRCNISGNHAVGVGAIENTNTGALTITNSTITGNSAHAAGGIGNEGTLIVEHSTIVGNSSVLNASGIATGAGSTTFRNSILAANSPGNCSLTGSGTLTDGGYNLDDGHICGSTSNGTGSLKDTDPKLAATGFTDNGGPTWTIALDPTSPAINAIPVGTNGCGTTFTTDQRGFGRPAGTGCDIGAFEHGATLDLTPPVIDVNVSGTLGQNDWYVSDVTVTWMITDPESGAAGCPPVTIDYDTPGALVSCEATSGGGSSSRGVTIMRDATAPTLAPTVTPNPVVLNGTATASPNASDEGGSGLAASSCNPVSTSTVGNKSVGCTATDNAGNGATGSASYAVTYAFPGFSQPVDNNGTLNVAKAGKVVPLKWRLLDGAGNPITTLASVTLSVTSLACSLGTTTDALEEYAQGSSGLQNLGNGYYQFNWATPAGYANSCKTVKLDLGEGSPRMAAFQFTR